MKIDKDTLTGLYQEAEVLYEQVQSFSDRVFDAGLEETAVDLGAEDAMRALARAMSELDRRIEFAKEDAKNAQNR